MITDVTNQQMLLPFRRMLERVEIAKDNSDDDFFNALMYTGELLTKLTALGMVAAVSDSRDMQQYRLKRQLVRVDGIGDWAQVIDEVLTGVPAQHLLAAAYEEAQQLNQRLGSETWQYEAVELIDRCLKKIYPVVETEKLPNKVACKNWFTTFATIRNKTRGHGALPSGRLTSINETLFESMKLVISNLQLFRRGWAYLQPTLRNKYRVTKWNDFADSLNFLKTREAGNLPNLQEGIYIHFGTDPNFQLITKVDLLYSDPDATDIYVANGGFNDRRFFALSYSTGQSLEIDAKPYSGPVTPLPPSETEGLPELKQAGGSVANLPPPQKGYITRTTPELRLYQELVDDNQHRIISLIGRGGIGKTWLTLQVLNQIADEGVFDAILWFSARDIDLLPDGAKQVKPHILTQRDVAEEFVRLVGPYLLSFDELTSKSLDKDEFLRTNMGLCELGSILFVFDNFETVKSPGELFSWIDTYLRLPNKCLITTRFREFKGDYPVELRGMSTDECRELIRSNASNLGIVNLLSEELIEEVIVGSGGHPYVIKCY